ncbi:unnamed protein product [Spirodela intermedia]|uniref:Uncharacterized protein n=2 Tax=Spirodela intermedia TaxID=51605 RepID=A0A7I8JC54_SPIIN|nr:unnamed protein product [Spirodela intermedia]CAA6667083.1 unnamed protein product [Spirodela intermedia]CAA7403897.1 unnamed protein product [Spirodela intermedia]
MTPIIIYVDFFSHKIS